MKLKEGIYESLVTNELENDMLQASKEGLVCRKDKIDEAESPSILAGHVNKIIRNKLSDEKLTVEERVGFANRLIEFLNTQDDDTIVDNNQILAAVVSKHEEARLKTTEQNVVRPLTGFRISNLFTGGQSKVPMNAEIERDIESADNIHLIVSFLKLSGLNLIYDKLKKFCENPNHKLRVITTTYCGVTEAKAVERLAQLPNTEIRISYNTRIERLHAKSYIFERNSGFSTAYIGSSNLSKSAQTDGLEWNIRVTNIENPHIIKTALATFDLYWNSHNFEDFAEGGVEKLYEDYKWFTETHPNRNRILFVAHRQEILVQSRNTYRSVLQDANFGDVWVGQYKPVGGIDHLFISVQTFNAKYDEIFHCLPSDYYDYIVIDEAHHLVADSYRKILTHFKPELLIGLTATPERMDGVSLLPDFYNQISAEIRLPMALDEGLLTPFQYLCISDNTDLTDDEFMQGNKLLLSGKTQKSINIFPQAQ